MLNRFPTALAEASRANFCADRRKTISQEAWFESCSPIPYVSSYRATIELTLPIKYLRGGSKSLLMMCSQGNPWVVKFQDNPQHRRVLANEFIATHIAGFLGLSVPKCALVSVSHEALAAVGIDGCRVPTGTDVLSLQFGSRFVGGLMPGNVVSDLLPEQFLNITNLPEFMGILALDRWLDNTDNRQAVFVRSTGKSRYRAAFIDNGHCFGCGKWTFSDSMLAGVYSQPDAYRRIDGWSAFEPWISRIETFSEETLWNIAAAVPDDWCAGDRVLLDDMIRTLIKRRSEVREGIHMLSRSRFNPFGEKHSLFLN